MAFHRKQTLSPSQLDELTQQRFLEIEMWRFTQAMKMCYSDPNAQLIYLIAKFEKPETQEKLYRAFSSHSFVPKTNEIVQYLRYKNLSVHKIRKLVAEIDENISTNSLSSGGKYDIIPKLYPILDWSTLPQCITNWKERRDYFNLFREVLVHSQEAHEIHEAYLNGTSKQTKTKEDNSPIADLDTLASFLPFLNLKSEPITPKQEYELDTFGNPILVPRATYSESNIDPKDHVTYEELMKGFDE